MRKELLLTKILLKCGMGSMLPAGKKKRQIIGQWALYLLIAVCIVPLLVLLYQFGRAMYQTLSPLRLEYLAYDITLLLLSLTTLILSLPFAMSVLFLAKDIEYLLPMPLSPWQIAGAKLCTVLLYEYITTAAVGIPMLAGIGTAAHHGIAYFLFAALVLLALPILPVIYGCLLGVLILPLTTKLRRKEAVTTLFSILIILLASGAGLLFSYFGETLGSLDIAAIITGNKQLLIQAEYLFPNLLLAGRALKSTDPAMLLLYVLTAAAAILVFLLAGNRFYLKAVSGMNEVSQKREKLSAAEEMRALKTSGIVKSCALREWKLLVRTPVYFLNCVLSAFLVPVILLAALIVPLLGNMEELQKFLPQVSQLFQMFGTDQLSGVLMLTVFALTTLFCTMNLSAATCISREGSNFIEMKYIPVPYKKQLQGKMLCAVSLSFAATLPYTFLLVFAGAAILKTPVWLLLPALAINVFTVFTVSYFQLLGDLWKPKLSWTSEQAAVKQNFIAMLTMLGAFLVCLLLGLGCIGLYLLRIPVYGILAAGIIVLGVLAFGLRAFAFRYGERALAKL
ncbi:hypothetical protein BRYFOR_08848 [Marvinbryantia formatexigens DSM 14469]|uniref:Uncharacterized protein n=1 Tax=Marvinbryantia formatexigens DSM 14469 TaxID=478749 RepID=C6LJL1_9FIRM|nr:hypothetical protein [Marvinbryantia formatexigens]EET59134.1 hypothetical protein BRYFOR_08848 [Marvinbryantia formatexigens DSM 14469]UWO26247.1 hypothetical protein NQ534_07225 [Marvinbryantia formatexigens DSM 14469]SDG10976.1 Putative ATP-binding cassette [Marvinbryantia formatexigens]